MDTPSLSDAELTLAVNVRAHVLTAELDKERLTNSTSPRLRLITGGRGI